jgi:hypothetical protein
MTPQPKPGGRFDNIEPLPQFDLSPDVGPAKIVVTIAGEKGDGKTTTALSFPGKIAAITLDRKTGLIKDWMKADNVDVYNGVRYYSEDSSDEGTIVGAGNTTYNYIHALLSKLQEEGKYDWIVIDGLEILHQICEQVMRFKHKLGPTDGFANLNWWKERRMFLRSIHNKALNTARRGIIYTTYLEFVTDVVDNEKTVSGKKHPKWVDVVLLETDIVLHAYSKEELTKKKYFVKVISSKRPTFIKDVGVQIDVTGPNFERLFSQLPDLPPQEEQQMVVVRRPTILQQSPQQPIVQSPTVQGKAVDNDNPF